MRGSVHAVIGASAPGILVLSQGVTFFQGAAMASISAGFAVLPDIDHSRSCASKALGAHVHGYVRRACKSVADSTTSVRDRRSFAETRLLKRDPYHRTVTHTLVAALGVGLCAYVMAHLGPVGVGSTAALGVLLLWPLYRRAVGGVVLWSAVTAVSAVVLLGPWLMALAVGGGYLSHLVADACTKAGVPLLWPLRIKGKRWWRIRFLGSLVTSGSSRENGPAVGVALVVNALLLLLRF